MPIPQEQGSPLTDHQIQEIASPLNAPSACYNIWEPNKLATANERIEALESELTNALERIDRLLAGD